MTIYVTYLTIYLGNLMPMFYIGYTSLSNIERGYHGTVTSKRYKKIWKQELRDNPHLFKTIVLTRHDVKADAHDRERRFQKQLGVVKNPLYINLSDGKQFDRTGVKNKKPAWNKGMHTTSEETKVKQRAAKIGKRGNATGTKKTEEWKRAKAADIARRKWITKGFARKHVYLEEINSFIDQGWRLGKTCQTNLA
jgi:hypothetical protein